MINFKGYRVEKGHPPPLLAWVPGLSAELSQPELAPVGVRMARDTLLIKWVGAMRGRGTMPLGEILDAAMVGFPGGRAPQRPARIRRMAASGSSLSLVNLF